MENLKTRRLAAIMFTDIVGYTALMQKDENAAADKRAHHRQEFEEYHEKYNGEILQYFGDGTLSVFQSGVEAVECAIGIQRALKKGEPVPLRIGLHMGDIVFDGTDIYGDGVNLASRIESMGVAGAILISKKLNDELKNQQQISTQSLGRFGLKNIDNPVEVFSVTNEGIKVPARSELKGKQKELMKTIAVLPFVNMSSDADNEYFSDGMTEEIINALAKIKELKVTSRTSSFFFKNKNIPIPQIGKDLNVSIILEGSIRLSGNKMRITAQLIDVNDDFHFWSETFDRSMEDIFAVQDEISLLIADKLREHLGHFEIGDHLVDASDISVENYKLYLKGKYHLLKMNKPNLEKAISILEQVIAAQPNFALAYLGVHQGYAILGTTGLVPAGEAFAKGQPFLDKAIELDKDLPESQLNLSWIAFLQNWDFEATYRHLNKVHEVRPVIDYYQSMASTLCAEGKLDAALKYIETAVQLDPFSAITYHLKGYIFYLQEKYKKAIACFEKSYSLKPEYSLSGIYWGGALLLMGRKEEGMKFFQNLPEDKSGDHFKLGGVTLANAALGNTLEAEAGIAKLKADMETDSMGSALNYLVLCYAMMGNQDAALDLIEEGIEHRLPMMPYLYPEPILKPLRSIPRFQELMKQIFGKSSTIVFSKRKYKKPLFDEATLRQYQQQLERLMADEQPHLDPSLTIRSLAEILGIPSNHLSQLLSEGFGKNFSEFVNSYRVETFKAKAADPAQQHLTILALAYDSGFNSKTVFNTFFKKMTGKTPKAYWKEVAK
jgi:TolB-like protein/class 3 adenylate cyclase/AraC-like DNA-binding protein/lipoprotein NlpI